MNTENEPLTDLDADLETLREMLKNFGAFSELDLKGMLKQYETGESDEV